MSPEPHPVPSEPQVLVSEHERRGEPLPPLVEIVTGVPVTPLPPLPERFQPALRVWNTQQSQFRRLRQTVEPAGVVDVKAGVLLLKQMKGTKADETVELHVHLGIDPTQSDRVGRGTVSLPHGVGVAREVGYKTDKGGWVHVGVGKMSFTEDKLVDNINALLDAVRATRPSGVKGNYIDGIVLSVANTPGIPLTI